MTVWEGEGGGVSGAEDDGVRGLEGVKGLDQRPVGSTTGCVPETGSAQVRDCLSHSAHQMPSPPSSQLTRAMLTRVIAWRQVIEVPSDCCTRMRQACMPRVWPRRVQNRPKKP